MLQLSCDLQYQIDVFSSLSIFKEISTRFAQMNRSLLPPPNAAQRLSKPSSGLRVPRVFFACFFEPLRGFC